MERLRRTERGRRACPGPSAPRAPRGRRRGCDRPASASSGCRPGRRPRSGRRSAAAAATTWLLVITWPCLSSTNPEPVAPPSCPSYQAEICTVLGQQLARDRGDGAVVGRERRLGDGVDVVEPAGEEPVTAVADASKAAPPTTPPRRRAAAPGSTRPARASRAPGRAGRRAVGIAGLRGVGRHRLGDRAPGARPRLRRGREPGLAGGGRRRRHRRGRRRGLRPPQAWPTPLAGGGAGASGTCAMGAVSPVRSSGSVTGTSLDPRAKSPGRWTGSRGPRVVRHRLQRERRRARTAAASGGPRWGRCANRSARCR